MLEIETFVENYFSDIKYSGDEIRVNCPMCDDISGHLYINRDKQVCHCFKCGYSRSWIGLVIDVAKVSYPRAIGELNKPIRLAKFDAKISKLSFYKENHPSYTVQLPEDFENIMDSKAYRTKNLALAYLSGRGYGGFHIKKYNLGLAHSVPFRIIIPVEFEYWQGRRLYEWMEPKYVNPKSDAKFAIFNSSALELYEEVIICEGCFSAISVGENAIALLGKEITKEKLTRLGNSEVKKFCVALDSDAMDFAVKLAEKLQRIGKEVEIWQYHNGDPAQNDGIIDHKQFNFKSKIAYKLGGHV